MSFSLVMRLKVVEGVILEKNPEEEEKLEYVETRPIKKTELSRAQSTLTVKVQ